MMYSDRAEAGRILADELTGLGPWPDAVILGIPRGGVVVAAEVARVLGLPLDVVATAKISTPDSPEFAIGAVSADGEVYPNPSSGFSAEEVRRHAGPARNKVAHSLEIFRAGRTPATIEGRTAIIVDDGLATGLTAIAAVEYVRRAGASTVVLAVPVAARGAVERLRPMVDQLVAVEVPAYFSAVGQFYSRFGQTEDAEVAELLTAADSRLSG